ncbi:unnamed protein product [Paramecium primaurelia]|uniref:poly(ADP-ribose) glycohydrolase n=1 Tax=Paramecium primaurelia TaxID=5886 RepID=A0A8S1KLW2_PARPR|nr:unnamed protein product [Paramecium primaurelia]
MKCNEKFKIKTLPYMIQSVQLLLQTKPQIQLLLSNTTLTLSRQTVFSLLSLMYFELTIQQSVQNFKFPQYFNFSTYYMQGSQLEKLKCLINYFNQCVEYPEYFNLPDIVYKRVQLIEIPNWINCQIPLSGFKFEKQKNEDHLNCGIVDFSDRFFGGKVAAGRGCAQEEVLLLINPEAIIATLFTSQLGDKESLIIQGILQFNEYRGYEDSFTCIPIKYINKGQTLIAIDALYFATKPQGYQFTQEAILRELNKSYIGFKGSQQQVISTGKWGCGIYGGDKQLKTLIQWISFSQACPDGNIIFNGLDDKAYHDLGKRLELCKKRYQTVGNIVKEILNSSQKNILDKLC